MSKEDMKAMIHSLIDLEPEGSEFHRDLLFLWLHKKRFDIDQFHTDVELLSSNLHWLTNFYTQLDGLATEIRTSYVKNEEILQRIKVEEERRKLSNIKRNIGLGYKVAGMVSLSVSLGVILRFIIDLF